MGSWSVYCGISKIAITSGQKCVLLPLKKNNTRDSYLTHLPATLPIFGEYDDYGGIENIEKDDNTKLIEEHFGVKIEKFCEFFTRGIVIDDEDGFPKKLKKVEEIKDWEFMFIDRQVYDFMSKYTQRGYGGAGSLDYGNKDILTLLGFKYNGEKTHPEVYDSKRYNREWELNGEKFYSDGTWLHHPKGSVYYFSGQSSSLSQYVEIPEDKKWVGEKAMWQLWEHLGDNKAKQLLLYIIGKKSFGIFDDDEDDNSYISIALERLKEWQEENKDLSISEKETQKVFYKIMEDAKNGVKKVKPVKKIADAYANEFRKYGKLLCDLVTIRHNLYPMSGTFEPYILYLTPQCGEYRHHQSILNKFAEINNNIMSEKGYDEDDE